MGGLVGYIIGAVVLLPILLIAYNYFFINKNDAKKYSSNYIANCIDIKLDIPQANDVSEFVKSKTYTTALQSKDMGRDGSRRTTMSYRVIHEQNLNKYFQIIMFDLDNGFWGAIDNNTIYAKVNKEDLANSDYGTVDKPVLVFSAHGIQKPLTQQYATNEDLGGSTYNIDTPPNQFQYNVLMYLTYIMSAKDFKARFEDKSK